MKKLYFLIAVVVISSEFVLSCGGGGAGSSAPDIVQLQDEGAELKSEREALEEINRDRLDAAEIPIPYEARNTGRSANAKSGNDVSSVAGIVLDDFTNSRPEYEPAVKFVVESAPRDHGNILVLNPGQRKRLQLNIRWGQSCDFYLTKVGVSAGKQAGHEWETDPAMSRFYDGETWASPTRIAVLQQQGETTCTPGAVQEVFFTIRAPELPRFSERTGLLLPPSSGSDVTYPIHNDWIGTYFKIRLGVVAWRPNVGGDWDRSSFVDITIAVVDDDGRIGRITRGDTATGVWIDITGSEYHVNADKYSVDVNRCVYNTNGILTAAGNNECGEEMFAPISGMVLFVGAMGGYGNTIILDRGSDHIMLLAHMQSMETYIAPGVLVPGGALVGRIGNTPAYADYFCHVHWTSYQNVWLPATGCTTARDRLKTGAGITSSAFGTSFANSVASNDIVGVYPPVAGGCPQKPH